MESIDDDTVVTNQGPIFVVRGFDLLDSSLQGCTMLSQFPATLPGAIVPSTIIQGCRTALGLPESVHAVPHSSWTTDVELHSTASSVPGTSARFPIILSLSLPPAATSRFEVRAYVYNPIVYCGEEDGEAIFHSMSKALGLDIRRTTIPHGLELRAHNASGLLAACEWVHASRETIADTSFEAYVESATEPTHTRPDVEESTLEGKDVVFGGVTMKCIRHRGDDVQLLQPNGKKTWKQSVDVVLVKS